MIEYKIVESFRKRLEGQIEHIASGEKVTAHIIDRLKNVVSEQVASEIDKIVEIKIQEEISRFEEQDLKQILIDFSQPKKLNNYNFTTKTLTLTSDYFGRPIDCYSNKNQTIIIDTLSEIHDGATFTLTKLGKGEVIVSLPVQVMWPDKSINELRLQSIGTPYNFRFNHKRRVIYVDTVGDYTNENIF